MKITVILLTVLFLTSCAGTAELKAPCDYQGTFCGKKIKINQ